MINKQLIPVGGLKKEAFSGSHNGMRYYMNGDDGKSSTTFTVAVYPEPWCYEQTPEENIEKRTFPLSEEGMDEAIQWLWDKYEEEKERWTEASLNMMHIVTKHNN